MRKVAVYVLFYVWNQVKRIRVCSRIACTIDRSRQERWREHSIVVTVTASFWRERVWRVPSSGLGCDVFVPWLSYFCSENNKSVFQIYEACLHWVPASSIIFSPAQKLEVLGSIPQTYLKLLLTYLTNTYMVS